MRNRSIGAMTHAASAGMRFGGEGFVPLFLTALLTLLASKGLALIPGYAGDDVLRLFEPTPGRRFLAQGRFTEAVIAVLANRTGLGFDVIWWPSVVLLMPLASVVIALSVQRATRGTSALPWQCLAAALAASAPLWTEIFLFRTAMPAQAAGWLALGGFLRATDLSRHPAVGAGLAAIAVAAGVGAYQPILAMFLALAMVELVPSGVDGRRLRDRLLAPAPLGFVAGIVLYAVVVAGSVLVFGSDAVEQRGGFISVAQIPDRAVVLLTHLLDPFGSRDPAMAGALFAALMGFLGAALLVAMPAGAGRVALAVAMLAATSLAILAPLMALAIVWLPGRTLMAGGFVIALAVALVGPAIRPVPARLLLVPGFVVVFLQCGASSLMLLDQQRMNRWDLGRARHIARDVQAVHDGRRPTELILVGLAWQQVGPPLRTAWFDRNISSLRIAWAVQATFREATGEAWQVTGRDTHEACQGSPVWPQAGAIHARPEGTIVCVGTAR
ncbi:glucosyltransferase domain-containing protein [Neoroseomonas soli]|uniref:Uncharacterized protein n=1 Tax=Neoroseomonas soli TaxID=1081025 RepID=A0A9X9WZT3_9PROT|nr:glucosyltransferase domain-containing protein [Neoroseomonas soli]MBR0672662.1 hypothetical protein [Neoroseomonas soli]